MTVRTKPPNQPGANSAIPVPPLFSLAGLVRPHKLNVENGGRAIASVAAAPEALSPNSLVTNSDVPLAEAYSYCGKLARSHYENFTIASWLMPRAMRRHMHAIYAYARIADDFADEEQSIPKLDQWQRELEAAYAGASQHPVMIAVADTARRFNIPQEPFLNLLKAFRSDVDFRGFETLEDLLEYARYSANPVGRLVLYLFGYCDPERQRLSDFICTGLQLSNFWQDVAIDFSRGRIYLPRRDMEVFGVTAAHLRDGNPGAEFAALLRHEIARAREMLLRGSVLATLVDQRLRRDVLLFVGGGLAILRAIERVGCDVFRARPKLSRLDYIKLGANACCGRLQL